MKASAAFTLVAAASVAAGAALYVAMRPPAQIAAPEISPGVLYTASFRDMSGRSVSLGRFSGHPVVLNFWATWCAPCREEMPTLSRVAARYAGRVQFVGLAQDDPEKVKRFAQQLAVSYPLWLGGPEVMDLSGRLGNRMQVLPFTVILDDRGRVAVQKVGAYSEADLDRRLAEITRKDAQPP